MIQDVIKDQKLEELTANVQKVFGEVAKIPQVYPDTIAMVRELGIQIEDVNFNLGYEELIAELKIKHSIDFEKQNLVIISSRPGRNLDVFQLFTESKNIVNDYREIQAETLSRSAEFYVINKDEWESIREVVRDDMYNTPVEIRIRRFRFINPECNYYTNAEVGYLDQFASGEVGSKMNRRDYLESMMGWLDEKVYFGEYLNYSYLVDGILAHAEKLEVEA